MSGYFRLPKTPGRGRFPTDPDGNRGVPPVRGTILRGRPLVPDRLPHGRCPTYVSSRGHVQLARTPPPVEIRALPRTETEGRPHWATPAAGPKLGEALRVKLAIFGAIVPMVVVLDWITKRWAMGALSGGHRIDLLGGFLPLTLAFNRGAAFGIMNSGDARWVFIPVTVVALFLLGLLIVQARRNDYLRLVALSLVVSGAFGNLYDRLRWRRGVVDFIGPVDLGFAPFPIFNVADIAITCGAALLAVSFWLEEREERRTGA